MTSLREVCESVSIEDIEDMLPIEAIQDICTCGSNDDAVEKWHKRLYEIELTKDQCVKLLSQVGAWDPRDLREEPLYALEQKVIWIAAWNVFENME